MQSVFHVLNLFQALTHVSEACSPLLDGCRKNRQKWQALAEQQEKNLINGESNQGKRNWAADLTATAWAHVADTVIGEDCILLNTVRIWLTFCHCCIIFPHFKIEHDHVDAEIIWRQYVSFTTSDWDGKRPARVVFATLAHKKVLVQALTVPESLLLYRCT